MRLFGSYTSPYVRRVRIFADAVGEPVELADVTTEAGAGALREVAPLRRVPVAQWEEGGFTWDSQAILEALVRRRGWGDFRPVTEVEREGQFILAVNGGLDSAVNVYYLRRDGVDVESVPYLVKQQERVGAALGWAATQLRGPAFGDGRPGFAEVVLFTTLEWMVFRNTWRVAESAPLAAFREFWAGYPGWAASAPR